MIPAGIDLHFDASRAFERMREFVAFAPSPPGTVAHENVAAWLTTVLGGLGLEVTRRPYVVRCSRSRSPLGEPPGKATITNLLARVPGVDRELPPYLLGTHYDTRWIADREPNARRRNMPIPGANDGGSGTACLLELARVLVGVPPPRDVVIALFDGEDLGDIDGHDFCVGSTAFARERDPAWWPAAAIVLDMVGGENAHYRRCQVGNHVPASWGVFSDLFRLGRAFGLPSFREGGLDPVYSDQGPLIAAGVPAALLIDLDYPQWHTQSDTLDHCSAQSLGAAGIVAEAWIRGLRAREVTS